MNDKHSECFGKVNIEQNGGKESGLQFKRVGPMEKVTF